MNNSLKKFYATLLTVILILAFSVPFFANAQQGTLGTENPKLTATFVDSNGQEVDGNSLTAGRYTVSISLSGMKAVSIFQLTASFTQDITINSAKTIADKDSSFSCGALIYDKSPFIVGLASKNTDTSPITKDGTVMVTMDVTVANSGDFANYFRVDTDPDFTFIEADYRDGVTDAYVCSENTGAKYPQLTYDMSPEITPPAPTTFDVNGQITVARDVTGELAYGGIAGITVSVNDTEISATTDSNGNYTLPALEEGTYTLSISGPSTIDRTVTLVVSAEKADEGEINVDAVPIIIADYNRDNKVNETDVALFYKSFKENNVYADYNCDKSWNETDIATFYVFFDKTINYADVTL